MRPRHMYIGRRRRRTKPAFLFVGVLLVAIIVGGAYGAYTAMNRPDVAQFILLAPTATPSPTPTPMLAGVVTDAYSGTPIAGATVEVAAIQLQTGADGTFRIDHPGEQMDLRIVAPLYETAIQPIRPGMTETMRVALRPTRLEGVVRGGNGQPLAGARVAASAITTTTGPDGRYELNNLPPDAELIVEAPDHARHKEPVGKRIVIDVALRTNTVSGVVKSTEGKSIAHALVIGGKASTKTDAEGKFRLTDVTEDGQLVVKAGGFKVERRQVKAGSKADITLSPLIVKAIYLTQLTAANDKRFNELLALVKRTELNAMVIDIKGDDGHLFYDSKVPLAREIDAVAPTFDVRQRLQQLRDANVYSIARIVVMEDTTLASARPEWAVRNTSTGKPWRDFNNIAWMNAYRSEVWDYNIAIAKEVAELGFDEVQYDYVRFPSDGPLAQADYGRESTEEARSAAISTLLARTKKELDPLGVFFSADIFGLTTVAADDLGIGQKIEAIANAVDYICPMVYPSHYARGSFGFSNPAAEPYEVVFQSMEAAQPKLGQGSALFRPWLQDFDLYGTDYTPDMVRAQIRASEENGSSGWLLWNAANEYQEAALRKGD